MDLHEESQLPLWGQSCLRLIEQIDAFAGKIVLHELQKALAVRTAMIVFRTAAGEPAVFLLRGRDIIKALGTQKITPARLFVSPDDSDRIAQL